MKIAWINQYILWDDARNLDIDVLNKIAKIHDVEVFTQKKTNQIGLFNEIKNNIKCFYIDTDLRNPKMYIIDKILKKLFGIRKFATDVYYLSNFLKKSKPDIIYVDGVFPWGILTFFAKKITKINSPILITRHCTDYLKTPFTYDDQLRSPLIEFISKIIYRHCFIRANSYKTKEWILLSGGIEKNIFVIPVSISDNFVYTFVENNHINRHFISISRLTPMKGLDNLLTVFHRIIQKYPNAILDIYGPDKNICQKNIGSYKKHLEHLILKLNLQNNVFIKNAIKKEDVTKTICQYKFNIVSSYGETLNLVVPEAATVSIPSIATQTTGVSSYIEQTKSGIVCTSEQANLFASIENAILINPQDYRTMKQNCKNLSTLFSCP